MRISDWSSDVCSSDLLRFAGELHLGRLAPIALDRTAQAGRNIVQPARDPLPHVSQPFRPALDILAQAGPLDDAGVVLTYRRHRLIGPPFPRGHLLGPPLHRRRTRPHMRSEEHTSELQSLMRISYAVFCLKKKKKKLNTID